MKSKTMIIVKNITAYAHTEHNVTKTNTHTDIYIYNIYTHTYIYIHIHTHICMCMAVSSTFFRACVSYYISQIYSHVSKFTPSKFTP